MASKEKMSHLAQSKSFVNSFNDNHDCIDSKSLDCISSPKVWVEAFGCSANIADSQAITGILSASGFEIAKPGEKRDLNIIVTCSVKDTTEHKMISRIKALSLTGKPLIIAGCLAKTETAKLERLFSGASLLGPRSLTRTVSCANAALQGKKSLELEDVDGREKLNIPRVRINPIVSIIQIGVGCMSECTFCQTKLAKGNITSYRIGDIIRAIEKDTKDGCREIWLSSTDNGCYGFDIGTDITELLKKCKSIAGDFRIRIGMMNPMYMRSLKEGLNDLLEESSRIYRFLHIPVQSGSERILRSMKRGHTAKMYKDVVKSFRERRPDITIGTDIIVGFPGENEIDFENTLELISESKPDIVNCSRYSARTGTPASVLEGRLATELAKDRSTRLHQLAAEVTRERNRQWVGWRGGIVIDEIGQNFVQGRNYAYKPIFIRKGELDIGSPRLGDLIMAHVKKYSSRALEAVVLS
ncbi:MAG: tRNA (N(6)-L-threonylcarbamoyladenosine(37)-C(2))-methylthiotransferase [Nitrososphaeraceae archaeon]